MSELNLTWRKYGLADNPYFHSPLTIEGGYIPITSFVGRDKEKAEIKNIIALGSDVRCLILGDAGVGKTSLVNFVRDYASKEGFFTPIKEIELNRLMSGNEFIILTISSLYEEIKRREIDLGDEWKNKLEALYELTQYGELSHDIANITQLNRYKLMDLFRNLVDILVHPRYKAVLLHFDNLDNIDDHLGLADLIGDIRDFLLTKNVIFIFVGDRALQQIVNFKVRVGQLFLTTPVEVPPLSLSDINKVLKERIEKLSVPLLQVTTPHTEEAIEILFKLHQGNLREILNSLTSCVTSLPASNTPIPITEDILKEVLFNKANELYVSKLTPVEKDILIKMIDVPYITPTELAKKTGKSVQNISSKYIPYFINLGAVKLKNIDGRNKYYEITPQIKWWRLQRTIWEKQESRRKTEIKVNSIVKKLTDFY